MTRTRVLRTALLLLVAATVAACDYSHGRSLIRPSYRPALFNYAAGGRDLKVETIGNPFADRGLDDQEIGDFVAASMQGHNWGQPTNFTATPGESARPQYKVVVAFNPVEPATYRAICEGDVRSGPTADRVRVKAAFCEGVSDGQRVLTGVRASVISEAGPDSSEFQAMMAGVTRDLFPIWAEEFDDDCPSLLFFCH